MLLYIFWASLSLGLIRIPAETRSREESANRHTPSGNGAERGTTKPPDRPASTR
jgi:hypothetical protein